MNHFILHRSLAILAFIAGVLGAPMAHAKLTVGDPAPKLQPGNWIQGEPVNAFDSNHVYIVEFWATWCGPCRQSIPHLNQLQEKFKDKGLVAIGQNVWEPDDAVVAPFVKKMGSEMSYRVALDDKTSQTKGAMADTWMAAAGQDGIPTAFVINRQGRIAWIGHPMVLNEAVLGSVLAGTFDLDAYAKKFEAQQEKQARRDEVTARLQKALQEKNWDAAEKALSEIELTSPEGAHLGYGLTRLRILLGRKDYTEANKLAQSLSDEGSNNIGFQNEIAWLFATQEGIGQDSLAVAEKIAGRANTIAKVKSPALLDTLARVQFRLGKSQDAVATQQQAIDASKSADEKRFLEKTLGDYKKGKLPPVTE